MEAEIRCNIVLCRKVLSSEGRACVTTCSHIFCVDCANKAFSSALVCPACETSLTENDDIVFADLNPNEDYKSSVLSGLRPDIVMEICTRALSFWTYQTTQEACFQEILYKNLEEKYTQIEKNLQGVMRDAQAEINTLSDRVSALQKDIELEKRKSHDLSEQLQEKGRQFSKLQVMYDKLKRRTLVPAMQQTIQNVVSSGAANGATGNNLGINCNLGTRKVPIAVQAGINRRPFAENLVNRPNHNSQIWNTGCKNGGQENLQDPFYAQQQNCPSSLNRNQSQHPKGYSSYHGITSSANMGNDSFSTNLATAGTRRDSNSFQQKASVGQSRNRFAVGQNTAMGMTPNGGMRG
ncbi:hypothetical protein G9A89_008108 [Geosiphon pyriformis]|nr:hypothetical protein G9A89_008108 [Geosiphon pyriformis]